MALERLKKLIFILVLAIIPVMPAFSETVTSIETEGLRRTEPETFNKLLQRFIGREADTEAVTRVILGTGLFDTPEVSVTDGVMHIKVKEKHSLLPIPFASASSGSVMGGIMLMDNNFAGRMDKVGIGGMISEDSYRFFAGFNHRQTGTDPFGWKLSTDFRKTDYDIENEHGSRLGNYEGAGYSITGGIGRRILPWLTGELASGIRSFDSEISVPVSVTLRTGTGSWDGVFLNSASLSMKTEYNFAGSDNSFPALTLKGSWEQPLLNRLRLTAEAGWYLAPDVPAEYAASPSVAGFHILNSRYKVSEIAACSAGLEWSILNLSFGMLTLYGQFQGAYLENVIEGDTLAYGPVGGLRFYLKKIAFPAINIYTAYNMDTGNLRISAGAGFSF